MVRGGWLLLFLWVGDASLVASGEPPAASELRLLTRTVNQHRLKIGCKPLVWDERLAQLASRYSETMAREEFFGHTDRAGDGPFDRMGRAGIRFRAAGENLARGHTTSAKVFAAWMRSRSHRRNIEYRTFTHHGIGFYRYRWCHLFARYESGSMVLEAIPIPSNEDVGAQLAALTPTSGQRDGLLGAR